MIERSDTTPPPADQYSIPACPGWVSPSGAEAYGVTLNLNRRTADGEENIESAKDYN